MDGRDLALAFIDRPSDLRAAALALYRWQIDHVPAYGRFADGAAPDTLEAIPAVPVALFRGVRFCATDTPGALFRSSGTTGDRRSEHAMPDAGVYEAGAQAWFNACVPGAPVARTLSLVTPSVGHPESSLGHMIDHFAPGAVHLFDPARGVDRAAAWRALREAEAGGLPVFLPTTAFALADLFDAPGAVSLPAGSVLMITGGFKGRRDDLQPGDLEAAARARLGERVLAVGEYGMTELSSQLWDVDGRGFTPPPWLHVYAVDPWSGEPVEGEGLLRFVDLANWGSCLAIETRDMGVVRGGRVPLRGRLEGAPHRGCSLPAEEARWRR